jgi:hypothetical protein
VEPVQKLRDDPRAYLRLGAVARAALEGRPCIVEELDRCARPSLFPCLFEAAERGIVRLPPQPEMVPGVTLEGALQAAPGFNLILTCNRRTDLGTHELPAAGLRRFLRIVLFDPVDALTQSERDAVYGDPLREPERLPDLDAGRQALDHELAIVESCLESLFSRARSASFCGTIPSPYGRLFPFASVADLLPFCAVVLRALNVLRLELAGIERISPAESAALLETFLVCEDDAVRVMRERHAWPTAARSLGQRWVCAVGKSIDSQSYLRDRFTHLLAREVEQSA